MKYLLITLLAFTMMFFTACELTDCDGDGEALMEMTYATQITEYTTASSNADTSYTLPTDIADNCNDYVAAMQDLVDAGCSYDGTTFTQEMVDANQTMCDGFDELLGTGS